MPIITVREFPTAIDPPRASKYKNRHTPAAASREIGIPQAWIWFWVWSKKLKASQWLGKAWVNLEEAREVASSIKRADLAYEATSEPIRSRKGAEFAKENWHDVPEELSHLVEAE
jgi:hypothetical protein